MTVYLLKRIYDEVEDDDGYRVLVDRLWPRGISKEHAALGEWCTDVAPSTELRTWYGHRPERFEEFAERYRIELQTSGQAAKFAKRMADKPTVTLLVGAKQPELSQGAVLQELLRTI
ncbi:DUF488 family protein [Brooklawnia sp.]|uniref:DUF488 domain-containing protein n=1 Tax=Brooklawnia sp. TaxID=2699740 RepID=UPI00311E2212